ncbi:MAG: hypothetical protein ACYS7Y_36615 [Planctomycetota bacterium]|jgi:hypothetical protein
MAACHKCGYEVKQTDDKALLMAEFYRLKARVETDPETKEMLAQAALGCALGGMPCHIIANPQSGCEGSPSLAQYLPGQPMDGRCAADGSLLYPMDPNHTATMREAWNNLQNLQR